MTELNSASEAAEEWRQVAGQMVVLLRQLKRLKFIQEETGYSS